MPEHVHPEFPESRLHNPLIEQGWTTAVSSTHSHLASTTRVKRGNWDRFRIAATDQALAPAAFLETEKNYLPRIAAGARIVEEDAEYVTFEHQPCPKFRVALPLLRPWLASGYKNQQEANDAWKERIEALAATLGLSHDQACTDTSRLFYLPRRPINGPPAETATLKGMPCDIFALPAVTRGKATGAKPNAVHFEARGAYDGGPWVTQDWQPWPVFLLACRLAFV
jgi:hypothetical protein